MKARFSGNSTSRIQTPGSKTFLRIRPRKGNKSAGRRQHFPANLGCYDLVRACDEFDFPVRPTSAVPRFAGLYGASGNLSKRGRFFLRLISVSSMPTEQVRLLFSWSHLQLLDL